MNIVSRCRESLWVYGYLKECGGVGEDVISRLFMLPWLKLCLVAQTVGKLLNALL